MANKTKKAKEMTPLKRVRVALKLNQDVVAAAMGIPREQLSRYETGARAKLHQGAAWLATARGYGVSLQDAQALFDGTMPVSRFLYLVEQGPQAKALRINRTDRSDSGEQTVTGEIQDGDHEGTLAGDSARVGGAGEGHRKPRR